MNHSKIKQARHILPFLALSSIILWAFLLVPMATPAMAGEKALVRKAMQAFEKKRWKKAQQLFEQIRKKHPKNPQPYYFLGEIHLFKNRPTRAARFWRLYAKLDPVGATSHDVPRRLTMLEAALRQKSFERLF